MEQSGGGDDCRRTADFYEALCCYEVVGLAGVVRIRLSGSKPSYNKICYSITPHSPVDISLQASTQNTLELQIPSVPSIKGRLNNVQECQVGSATGGQ